MNWLLVHVLSGEAFFTGAALWLLAALASLREGRWAGRAAVLGALLGTVFAVVSSTPLPWWLCAVLLAAAGAWIVSAWVRRWRRGTAWALMGAWLAAAAYEAPYHVSPRLAPAPARRLTIVGDSLTAGVGSESDAARWPGQLARRRDLQVQEISRAGATARSILPRVRYEGIAAPVVLVEIGGNDLLGAGAAADFARDLDALLRFVSGPGRQVAMFELPLPPFCHAYGRIQRELAARYGVALIPKRVLLDVLAADGATLDTLHLTPEGHARLADRTWGIVEGAFP